MRALEVRSGKNDPRSLDALESRSMVCPDVGASRFDTTNATSDERGQEMTRKTGTALASILHTRDHDGTCDRVLRASFWLPSSTRGCAEPTALEAFRARREQTRT
jgi:hypothetical protein